LYCYSTNVVYIRIMKTSGIYILQSRINSDIFYIGATVNLQQRKSTWLNAKISYLKKYPPIYNHLRKFCFDDLEFKIIEICESYQLFELEQYYISEYNPPLNTYKFTSAGEDSKKIHLSLNNDPDFNSQYLNIEHQILEFLSDRDLPKLSIL